MRMKGKLLQGLMMTLVVTLILLTGQGVLIGDDDSGEGKGKGKEVGQSDKKPPVGQHGGKEGWEGENPPGWENWDVAKRQTWKHGLERAKDAVKKHEQKRLEAALRALEKAARKGLPLAQAEKVTKAGLDRGLGPFDFEPLGKFVVEKHRQGLKGEELAEAIHQEIKHRQAEREEARKRMKEEKGLGRPEKGKGKGKQKFEEVDEREKRKDKGEGSKADHKKEKGKGRDRGKKGR